MSKGTSEQLLGLYTDTYRADLKQKMLAKQAKRAEGDARYELLDAVHGTGRGYNILSDVDFATLGKDMAIAELLRTRHDRAVRHLDLAIDRLYGFAYDNEGRPARISGTVSGILAVRAANSPTRELYPHAIESVEGDFGGCDEESVFVSTDIDRPPILGIFKRSAIHASFMGRVLGDDGAVMLNVQFLDH